VDVSSAGAIALAPFTGWTGYAFAGRRWRREERRSVYRDFLLAAHEAMDLLWTFEGEWKAQPEIFPEARFTQLERLARDLQRAAQDVRLLAPASVNEAASHIWISLEELFQDQTRRGSNAFTPPASYAHFDERRRKNGFGPWADDLDEFINLARVDLGVESRLFWRLRGEATTYRRAFRSQLVWRWGRHRRRFDDLGAGNARDE
jgi:hypothetical protein